MLPELTHDEIISICAERDMRMGANLIHYITCGHRTFKLHVATIPWSMLNEGERYCIIKNRNVFDTEDDANAAIEIAISYGRTHTRP